ncbi:LytR C-terminal domain-containing protein, partial [Kitasatospora sp. NPDC059571]|uniref:LytR C-terminal domain-containing protein n=1 Tax=Kitasatospora sp. NPDC059571 TaxID=3346871 RepID=UPI0036AD1264
GVLHPPAAGQLFARVAEAGPIGDAGRADTAASAAAARSTATAASRASGRPSPAALLDPARVEVTVRNGTGIGRQAGRAAAELQAKGFTRAEAGGNAPPASTSSVGYPAGRAEEAAALATALGLPAGSVRQSASLGAKDALVVVLGTDYTGPAAGTPAASAGTAGASAGPDAPPTPSGTPADLQRVAADDTGVCAR